MQIEPPECTRYALDDGALFSLEGDSGKGRVGRLEERREGGGRKERCVTSKAECVWSLAGGGYRKGRGWHSVFRVSSVECRVSSVASRMLSIVRIRSDGIEQRRASCVDKSGLVLCCRVENAMHAPLRKKQDCKTRWPLSHVGR